MPHEWIVVTAMSPAYTQKFKGLKNEMTSDICQNFCSKIFVTGDGKDWTLTRTRTLTSSSSPDYAVLEASGQGIIVSSDKPFKLVSDSQSSPQTAAVGTTQEQETDREGVYGQAPFG